MKRVLHVLGLGSAIRSAVAALLLGACATPSPPQTRPPAVAVHAAHSAHSPEIQRARTLFDLGHYEESLRASQAALQSARSNPGPNRANVGDALQCEAQALFRLGRFQDVVTALNEAADIVAATSGKDSPELRILASNLADAYFSLLDYSNSAYCLWKAIEIADKGTDIAERAMLYGKMANVQLELAQFDKARTAAEQAIQLESRVRPPDALAHYHRTFAQILSATSDWPAAEGEIRTAMKLDAAHDGGISLTVAADEEVLGDLMLQKGTPSDALEHYERGISILQAQKGLPDAHALALADALEKVAGVYARLNKDDEAIDLYNRSIAIRTEKQGADSLGVAFATVHLANLYYQEGQATKALQLVAPVVETFKKNRVSWDAKKDAVLLTARILVRTNRAEYQRAGRMLFEEIALEQREGGDRVAYGETMQEVGLACLVTNDEACANHAFEEALQIQESLYSPSSPHIVSAHMSLGTSHYWFHDYPKAVSEFTFAIDPWIAHRVHGAGVSQSEIGVDTYIDAMWRVYGGSAGDRDMAAAKTFLAAQLNQQTRAALALSQMSERVGAGTDALAQLVRREQDLENKKEALSDEYAKALSGPRGGEPATIARIRGEITDAEAQSKSVRDELHDKHRPYEQLTAPPVVPVSELQAVLKERELLVTFEFGPHGGFAWAIGKNTLEWTKIEMTAKQLAEKVESLRQGLDTSSRPLSQYGIPDFDRSGAYELYRALFGDLASVDGATQLLVVPSGALWTLPLGVLVTQDPGTKHRGLTAQDYARTAWLIRDKAITVLPSASGLRTLRTAAEGTPPAAKPFLGIGDPVIGAKLRAVHTDDLPDTKTELEDIRRSLGDPSTLCVGGDATKECIRQSGPQDYRVIVFATHGLEPGNPEVSEPALVLSPATPSDRDNQYLTASEIAGMNLNADWVVLSACNTAAGGTSSKEQALSGLARAFIYAGAHGALVSHWEVLSPAAAGLTKAAFQRLRDKPALGKAAALQWSMNDVRSHGGDLEASPLYWAPFSFVGDGD